MTGCCWTWKFAEIKGESKDEYDQDEHIQPCRILKLVLCRLTHNSFYNVSNGMKTHSRFILVLLFDAV